MKLCMRSLTIALFIFSLIIAGLSYVAADRLRGSSQASRAALSASLDDYRHAQALKAHASGFELTMNEFYSTVLDYPVYRNKFSDQKVEIERTLSMIGAADEGSARAVKELGRIYKEMDGYRVALEAALGATDKDWDAAREALFKINVLSVQVIAQADLLAQLSQDRAMRLEQHWQAELTQTIPMLYLATALAALIAISLIMGIFFQRRGQAATGMQTA